MSASVSFFPLILNPPAGAKADPFPIEKPASIVGQALSVTKEEALGRFLLALTKQRVGGPVGLGGRHELFPSSARREGG